MQIASGLNEAPRLSGDSRRAARRDSTVCQSFARLCTAAEIGRLSAPSYRHSLTDGRLTTLSLRRGASAQAAASRAPPPPTPLSASSFNADAINAATVQAAKAVLGGLTLRCGISNVKSDCPSPSERTANSTCLMTGSTFAGVDPLDTDTLQAVADAPWGTSVGPLPPASVVGLTAFVLQYAARHSGLNVEFYAARVPPVVQYNADSTQSYMCAESRRIFGCGGAVALWQSLSLQSLLRSGRRPGT